MELFDINCSITKMIKAYEEVGYSFCIDTNTLKHEFANYCLCVNEAYEDWAYKQHMIFETHYHRSVNHSLTSAAL